MQFGRVSGPEPVLCGPDDVAIEVSRGTEWQTRQFIRLHSSSPPRSLWAVRRADGCGALSSTSPSSDAGDYEAPQEE